MVMGSHERHPDELELTRRGTRGLAADPQRAADAHARPAPSGEIALASDSEVLQKLLYNIPVMIRYADQQGRIAWVNREWERCLGWSLAEARQKDVLLEMYPDPVECERVRRFIGGAASGGWRDFRTRVRDGRMRDTTWANVVLSDGTTVGIGQDVTERKRRASQLQALADAALAIGAATSIAGITQVATEAARQTIGAHCSVTSFTEQNWAQAIIATSLSEKYAGYRSYDARPDGSGIYRLVCESNRPMRLTQAELLAHPAWRGFGRERANHPPLRGWLAVP
jgi:PAS domain S-box-containing protein